MNIVGLSKLGLPQATRKASTEGKPTSAAKSSDDSAKTSFASMMSGTPPPKTTDKAEPNPAPANTPTDESETENLESSKNFTSVSNGEMLKAKTASGPVGAAREDGPEGASLNTSNLDCEKALPPLAPGLPTGTPARTPAALRASAANLALTPALGAPAEDQANALTRRVVWNDFLRKMGDLGLSAEDVLKAFGALSEKELAQPPEQSIDKLVQALGVQGQQAVQAKQCFQELMLKTKATTLGEGFNSAPPQNSLAILSQRNLEKRTLQKSLEKMDRNFFMPQQKLPADQLAPSPAAATRERGPLFAATRAPDSSLFDASTLDKSSVLSVTPLPLTGLPTAQDISLSAAEAQQTMTPAAQAMASAPPSEINQLVAEMHNAPPGDKKALDEIVRNFTLRQAAKNISAATPATIAPGIAGEKLAVAPVAPATQAVSGALSGIFAGSGKNSPSDSGADDFSEDAGFSTAAVASENRLGAATQPKNEFQTQLAQAGARSQPMAVPELMQQAQVMVREGGGDMKVTLHPDGLGQLAMRVSVQDGKVSVQMITESDEAKKLIERQIGELKAGLSANHLQVESIKVDTASNMGQQLEQQYRDASRQQAQANMEQFRQDHQGWRRSFFETGSANPYTSQGDAPRDARAPNAAARSKNNSRRLDLVA